MFRRASSLLLAATLAVPLVLGTETSVAHADEELRMTSTTTYTIDAETGVVHVVTEASLKNLLGCRYYFPGFYLPIPIGTSPAVVTTPGGSPLKVAVETLPDTDDYVLLDISFRANLLCNRTMTAVVTYDLLGNAPRSENPSRINSAYAGFLAFGIGDDVTIRVVVPPSFTSETFGDDVVETHDNGNTIYTATDIDDANQFEFFVSASRNSALVKSELVTDDGYEFQIETWPGDTEWQEFITTEIESGVPILVELIGQPWPIDEPVDVRESHTPYLYGYAGWFSIASNELEIGEDLDQDTALHELSHAWFSDGWFTDRWLSEGFAQVFASKGVEELGGHGLQPLKVVKTDVGFVLLNNWGDPTFNPDVEDIDDLETYGYNASFYVVQQIAEELGDDQLREVLDAVANDFIAYRGEGSPESPTDSTDWRRFLDLVEEIGGSTKAIELIEQYVATGAQSELLAERATTRDEYHQLVDDGGEWAAPVVVRERMADWDFAKATELITAAQAVLELRDQLDTKVAELGATYPDKLETLYEGADEDFNEAKDEVQQQLDTADALLAAVAADGQHDGFFGSIGLIGTDLAKTLDDAKAAFAAGNHDEARDLAQDVIDQVNDASSAGKLRAGVALGALLLIAVGTTLLIRRRRRQHAAAAAIAAPDVAVAEVDALSDANQTE